MEVSVSRCDFFPHRMRLKAPFVWARGEVSTVTNIIVQIRGEAEGGHLTGWGEAVPRGALLTGDLGPPNVQAAMQYVSSALLRSKIPVDDVGSSLTWIADFMGALRPPLSPAPPTGFKPYRGLFCGVESALLDIAAKVHGLTVAQMLEVRRDEIAISARTIADRSTPAELIDKVGALARRFPVIRIKGPGTGREDLERLTTVADILRKRDTWRPLWIDINGRFPRTGARGFIDQIAALCQSERLPEKIIIEQPIERSDRKGMSELQDYADQKAGNYGGEIVIMADESVWDSSDVQALLDAGGCRAVNIKIPKAGGLLEALKAARLFVAENPDGYIDVGGFPGTGDINAWAIVNFALALPRLDYLTSIPPTDCETRLGVPQCNFRSDDSNVLEVPTRPGLGAEVDMIAMRPLLLGHQQTPPPPRTVRIPSVPVSARWG